jgi:hypothetical protein
MRRSHLLLFNVPVGVVTLRATASAVGSVSSVVSVLIVPGALSLTKAIPTP